MDEDLTRRQFVEAALLTSTVAAWPAEALESPVADHIPGKYSLTVNGEEHHFALDARVTLLDLLRERMHLTGTKKGCDHGQCGACTVLVNDRRELSCLSLAISHAGDRITTIEGLAQGNELHPMQAAFLEHDGFQCSYCTSGQICSAVGMLAEARAESAPLTDAEIRERMSGNICRCGAYPNIVAAVRSVAQSGATGGRL